MRTANLGGTLAPADWKQLDRMLTGAPAQLLCKLPRSPRSVLEFSEKLYLAGLPPSVESVDQQMSPCERALERVQHHFIATEIEAETLLDIYMMARVTTASMERDYIGWCHKLSELSVGSNLVKSTSRMRMGMVICAPTYVQPHKGFLALQRFIGCPIPHRTWTDFDAQGNAVDTRKAIYWQLVLLLVRMPKENQDAAILEAIVDAYDQAGSFNAKAELEAQYGRGRYRVNDVVRRLRIAHVAVVVVYDWKHRHRDGDALWEILHELQGEGIAVVLVATAAIALCKDNRQFRAIFPCDPVEFAPYDVAASANLGRAYAETMGLTGVPRELVEAVQKLYGFRQLLDVLAGQVARRVHLEGMDVEAAMRGAVEAVHRRYQSVLAPFKHLRKHKQLAKDAVAAHSDLLPLVLVDQLNKKERGDAS